MSARELKRQERGAELRVVSEGFAAPSSKLAGGPGIGAAVVEVTREGLFYGLTRRRANAASNGPSGVKAPFILSSIWHG